MKVPVGLAASPTVERHPTIESAVAKIDQKLAQECPSEIISQYAAGDEGQDFEGPATLEHPQKWIPDGRTQRLWGSGAVFSLGNFPGDHQHRHIE